MNVKDAIILLQPLEGHHILILTNHGHGYVHGQPCLHVQHLPPDQRHQPGQGNIILWDGGFTRDGLQTGGTFWARDIRSIYWGYDHIVAHLHTSDGINISIVKQWRIDEAKGDQ